MLELIALFAPALIALKVYHHLKRQQLSARMLVMSYGIFLISINLCMYLITIYLLGYDAVTFGDKDFVRYVIVASLLALILPFVVNLAETAISVEVKRNGFKK